MEHDHTGEGEVPQHFFFLDASIEEMDNSTAQQYDMNGGSDSAGSEDHHLTAQESLLPSSISGKKRARQKIFAHRGTAFKKEEDCVLCSAFLNVSKDPIKGVKKNTGGYYKRIYKYYHDHKPEGSVRSQISLQKRWATIEKAVTKFCSFKSAVDRKNESGKNEHDRVEDAVKMYEKTEPFHFMHCWEMLRNEAKWNDKLLKVRSSQIVAKGATAAASNPEHGNDGAGMHGGSALAGSEDGQTGEGEVPEHFFLDASIEEIDNSTAHQYDMHGGSALAGSEEHHLTAQESPLPSSISGKKRARQKIVAHRGSAFKREEDCILCSAFLNVSKDPITGVNENADGYYKRIYNYYHDHKPEGSVRSQISIQKRWSVIQKSVTKFCSLKSAVDRKNESGKNEHDRVEDAVKMYEETEPFHFMHCWKMLHNETKWKDKLLEVRSTPILEGATAATSNPEHGNDSAPVQRHEGRDSTKRRRAREDTESSSTAHQYGINGGSASAGSEDYHLTAQESLLPSSISGKKQAREKRVAHRGSAFKKEEDYVLCSAFLNVSKDKNITGVNQNMDSYYKRIYDYYHDHKPEGSVRSQISLQKRWGLIQKAVTKFCSFKSAVDRKNESGKNEYDRIEDAVKMYEETEPFHFMHCWKMLRNEAKWKDKLLEVRSTPILAKGATAAASNPEHGNDSAPVERPEGRDSTKILRAREDTESSSDAVEVLQQIHDGNENAEGEQDQQMQEILNMKADITQISQKMFDLQKQDMEFRSKLKEEQLSINKEQLSLTKQDIEVRAKQSEAQLLTAEVGIMGADLEKLSPAVRSYYIMMQHQILVRRGVITPENNDGA